MPVSDNPRGALFMCISMFAFTLNDSLMKSATQTLPLFQSMAIRGVLTIAGLLVVAHVTGGIRLLPAAPRDRRRVALRSLAEVVATVLFLLALRQMPLANISAILQSVPLMVTLAAALFLGETVGWRRMTAICVGFLGVLLIVRPGGADFDLWSVLALASVVGVVARDLVTRGISHAVPAATVAVWAALLVTLAGFVMSIPQGWVMPNAVELIKLAAAAGALVVGYTASVMTMRLGDVGFIAPFRYTSLVWALLLGWIGFGPLPDGVTLIGAGVVVASGLYTLWRERRLHAR